MDEMNNVSRITTNTCITSDSNETAPAVVPKKTVTIVTFGRFDIFVDGKVVVFKNRKSKELIALCIDRMGGIVKMDEAISVLWDSTPYDERAKRRYRKAALSAYNTMMEAGATEVFNNMRGACYINKNNVECDLYSYIEGNKDAELSFRGEYMFDYSWSEKTLGWIISRLRKMDSSGKGGYFDINQYYDDN